jgi:peroxiredoxin Q/BCP
LEIDLLEDSKNIAESYGVWVEKNMYGKKYMGIERTSFLIDKNRKIAKIWKKVKPEGHAKDVLEYIKSIS